LLSGKSKKQLLNLAPQIFNDQNNSGSNKENQKVEQLCHMNFNIGKKPVDQLSTQLRKQSNIIMKVAGVSARDIVVWLPALGNPVLYMHDGQNIFDVNTAAYGVEWGLDETADSLIRNGFIKPIIIVGFYNASLRTPEYSQTLRGRRYRHFLIKKVKNFIDKNYRTLPDRENTICSKF